MTQRCLSEAVAAGVIDSAQAATLEDYFATPEAPARSVDPDDEAFRLVLGFNDIFVSLGIALLCAAVVALTQQSSGLFLCLVAWGLAEIFTRRRRMALPSILLSIIFVGASAGLAMQLMLMLGSSSPAPGGFAIGSLDLFPSLTILAAALLHFRRFRTPIDISLATAGALLSIYARIVAIYPPIVGHRYALMMLFGVAVFALAMRYDASDPRRVTIRADIAFWLHLLAAPLLIHGLLGGLVMGGHGITKIGSGEAAGVLVGAVFIAGVALLIDRRAMIVASLTYVGAALFALMGFDKGVVGVAVLLLGVAILALSIWWRGLREKTLALVPDDAWKAFLPPLRA